ncbi:NYN domain-containing protein [Sphingomonas cavernae]|nr:NYN domain-containing protein [Sphingomonas cavernae]
MSYIHGGGAGVRERQYLFIDGGALRSAVKQLSKDVTGDENELTVLYPQFASGADKVFYYDAISAQEHNEPRDAYERRVTDEHEKFDKIRALDRFHVALGEVKGKSRNRRQKQVDVRLAVDMLTHSFRRNMQSAVLFAGDDDFIPLVEALVRDGMTITIWHPPQATEALLGAADNRRPFTLKEALPMLTRDGVMPAFRVTSSGSNPSHPGALGICTMWKDQFFTYAGRWHGQLLQMWRQLQLDANSWEFINFHTPDSSLELALRMFDVASGWDISTDAATHLSAPFAQLSSGSPT